MGDRWVLWGGGRLSSNGQNDSRAKTSPRKLTFMRQIHNGRGGKKDTKRRKNESSPRTKRRRPDQVDPEVLDLPPEVASATYPKCITDLLAL